MGGLDQRDSSAVRQQPEKPIPIDNACSAAPAASNVLSVSGGSGFVVDCRNDQGSFGVRPSAPENHVRHPSFIQQALYGSKGTQLAAPLLAGFRPVWSNRQSRTADSMPYNRMHRQNAQLGGGW